MADGTFTYTVTAPPAGNTPVSGPFQYTVTPAASVHYHRVAGEWKPASRYRLVGGTWQLD